MAHLFLKSSIHSLFNSYFLGAHLVVRNELWLERRVMSEEFMDVSGQGRTVGRIYNHRQLSGSENELITFADLSFNLYALNH